MADTKAVPPEHDSKYSEATAHHDSEEYESAEEVYEEEVEEVEIEEEEVEEEEEAEHPGERDLDDDEDRKNPQFIPKKGYFYEHDDRTQADDETGEGEEKEEAVKEVKTKKAAKEPDRWTHDLYNDDEQAGKSKEEIIAIYGYDIRADDQPPKAVRRRRYGRDTRKYVRKSDDGDDHRKFRGGYRGGRGRRGSSFKGRTDGRGGGDSYDDEFPSLSRPDRNESKNEPDRDARDSNRGRSDSRGGGVRGSRGGSSGKPPPQRTNRPPYGDGDRGDSSMFKDRRSYGSDRGGRGGRGRRSEFTNRNRYRDRNETAGESTGSTARPSRNEDNAEYRQENRRPEYSERAGRVTNGALVNERTRNDPSGSKSTKPTIVAPFTNTEYTGSASLTAQSNSGFAGASSVPASKSEMQRSLNGSDVEGQKDAKGEPRRNQSKIFQTDRRSQMPPRLVQQQQVEQPTSTTGKPKKFSTQRQRQVADSPAQQTSVPSQMMPPVVPVQSPVVSASGNMVPSPVPNYTPQQPYFETAPANFEAQVYESAGSPMTGSGPSVSPSLWGPHAAAFAAAPYPSPPTGTQVQQQPYGDPAAMYAATPQGAPAIYAAPAQFIQDPSLLNFAPGPAPQYGAPFHPQGYQGYAQVTPAPPPEVYHGGVTYYNTHNQMQRPPVVAVQKRPKTVLQLIEPPEKTKTGKEPGNSNVGVKGATYDGGTNLVTDNGRQGEYDSTGDGNTVHQELNDADAELISKFSDLQTSKASSDVESKSSPPPQPQRESWASQMEQMSPGENITHQESNTEVVKPDLKLELAPEGSSESPSGGLENDMMVPDSEPRSRNEEDDGKVAEVNQAPLEDHNSAKDNKSPPKEDSATLSASGDVEENSSKEN